MITSDQGYKTLQAYEGFSSKVYYDSGGYPTIGYGTLLDTPSEEVYLAKEITRDEGLRLMKIDVRGIEKVVSPMISVPLSQAQYDAVIVFAYNVGTGAFRRSGLRKQINGNSTDLERIKQEFLRWTKVKGTTVRGLVNRRMAEYELYSSGTIAQQVTEATSTETEQLVPVPYSTDVAPKTLTKDTTGNSAKSIFIGGQHNTIVLFDPTLQLEEIKIFDKGNVDGSEKTEHKTGSFSPVIKINDALFQDTQIDNFRLSYKRILPELSVWILDKSGMFTSHKTIPKDGDIVSIYLKSEIKEIKPIRQDFRIIDVHKLPGGDPNGDSGTYVISAILHIDINNSDEEYIESTSTGVLQKIAKDMKIGYATNEPNTDDKMVWIRPMEDRLWFINHVIGKSYKTDDTFFSCFIDQWYYMCFVEMNKKMKAKELDKASIAYLSGTDYATDDPSQKEKMVGSEILLSNSPIIQSTPLHIAEFKPFNDTGKFWSNHGYMKELLYYRKKEKEGTQYKIDTLIGEVANDEKVLRGRADEDHTNVRRYVTPGTQMNDNVHKNYRHATEQNEFNMDNISKMGLRVSTSIPNMNIQRYDTIPVFIFNTTNVIKAQADNQTGVIPPNSTNSSNTIDLVLSGFYVVADVAYVYGQSTGKYHTEYTLIRREWVFD